MTQHLNSRAAITWSSTGDTLVEHLHQLAVPLRRVQPAYSRSVYVSESLDRTALETVTVGNGAYELVGQVTLDNNPQQLLELLKAGDAGRTLTYYPDLRDPNVNYPCRLIGPRGGSLLTDLDGQRGVNGDGAVELRLRPATTPSVTTFHPLDAASNVLFWLRAGDAITGATFARATTATYVDKTGIVRTAASGRLRLTWYDRDNDGWPETPAILVEEARTNGFTRSSEFDDAAWTKTACTVSANTSIALAPDGTQTADILVEDNTTAAHVFSQLTPALTDNTDTTFSVHVRANVRQRSFLSCRDKANNFHVAFFSHPLNAAGSVTSTTGTITATIERLGNSWFRIAGSFNAAAGATAPLVQWGPSTADGVFSYLGTSSNSLLFWGAQIEVDQAQATSHIPTTSVTVTRNRDELSAAFTPHPQPMTMYVRFRDLRNEAPSSTANRRILCIGDSDSGTSSFLINSSNGVWNGHYNTVTGGSSTVSIGGPLPSSAGDIVELSATLSSAGAVQLSQALNGGSVTLSSVGAAVGLEPAFNAATLFLGTRNAATDVAAAGLLNVAIVRGVHTLEAMRRVARVA